MRIGISTSVIQRGKSGVGQYVFALLRAMLAGSHQHKFVLFVLEEDIPLLAFAKDKAEIVAAPEKFRPPVKNIFWHQTRLPKLVRNLQLDVLHIPSYRRMLWPRPCPLVSTIHDLAPFHVAEKYDWKRMFYGRVVVRRLAGRQDRIIAISEYTAGDIVRFFGLPRERIAVIHNGLDHDRFHPGSREEAINSVAERFGLKHPFFLYVSRLEHPGKNHVRLISAFEEFKGRPMTMVTWPQTHWQLALAGGDWHGAEAIHAAIRNSKFTNDIRRLGFVPDEQLPQLYRAADAFVYPSLHEGFGLPPIEAMACGCPVITSTRGALAEVVGDAAAIIEPEDVHSIADKLRLLAATEFERNRLKTIGVEHARKFDWNKTAAETLRVYESVAADVRRRIR
jgi:glycosyltransferase involved in cell wall biosynthesis